jgi:hypothetical protein
LAKNSKRFEQLGTVAHTAVGHIDDEYLALGNPINDRLSACRPEGRREELPKRLFMNFHYGIYRNSWGKLKGKWRNL